MPLLAVPPHALRVRPALILPVVPYRVWCVRQVMHVPWPTTNPCDVPVGITMGWGRLVLTALYAR